MRLIALAVVLWSAVASASTGQDRATAAGRDLIGQPAPRLTLSTIDGRRIDLGSLYGKKAVYLKFWATWCVPCREQMPHFERTFETAGPNLAVIAVNAGFSDSLDEVRDYRTTVGLHMPIVIDDGRLADALHLRVTPQHVVIGRDGRILYVGHLVDDALTQALARAQAEPAGAVAPGASPRAAPPVDHVPARRIATLDGQSVALDAAGAPLVLVFLSPWCESYLEKSRPGRSRACRAAREAIEARLAKDSATHYLGIASGLWASREDLEEYRSKEKVALPLALDETGELFRTFGVREVPQILVVDRDGRIVERLSSAGAPLEEALARLAKR